MWQNWILPTLVISHLYLASYWVTTWAPDFTIASDNGVFATASLFFMPQSRPHQNARSRPFIIYFEVVV